MYFKPAHFFIVALAFTCALLPAPGVASAHCDTMGGPVVQAGQKALESGDINYALVWVQPKDEAELKRAFGETRSVRSLDGKAASLADNYFLETLVRIHRAGEGAPYTGIRPAGTDLGPAIPAADTAVKNGSSAAVAKLLSDAMSAGLKERYEDLIRKRDYKPDDVAAGREYVKAYVRYLHYVERLYDAATTDAAEGHESAER